MAVKANIDRDDAPSSVAAMGVMAQWRRNRQKPRNAVPEKASRGAPPATPKFDRTCEGLKGRGLVFDYADMRADWFTHVRREIVEYAGKEYTDRGDVWWTLKREKMKTLAPPPSLG